MSGHSRAKSFARGNGEGGKIRLKSLIMGTLVLITAQVGWAASGPCSPGSGVVLQVLGSGGPIADDDRASSAYLLGVEGRPRVLVDFGGGAFLRFGEAGADFADLDFIGISHFHADHSADFPALLKSGFFSRRSRPLDIAGPAGSEEFPGLLEFLDGLLNPERGVYRYLAGYLDGTGGLVRLKAFETAGVEATPVASDELADAGLEVAALGVPHGIVPTLAFRVLAGGRSIVFGSDQTGENPAFVDFARKADLLVMHMAIAGDADPVARRLHATPGKIGTVAAQTGARQLLLSHFMARSLRNLEDNVAAVKAGYRGQVLIAQDLLCVDVPDSASRTASDLTRVSSIRRNTPAGSR